MLPCGTPEVTGDHDEAALSTTDSLQTSRDRECAA